MPKIFYQSLNSSSSSSHGVSASNSQYFTRMAHEHAVQQDMGSWAYAYPVAMDTAPTEAVQGPPDLLETAPSGAMKKGAHSDMEMLSMVEGKARQIHQTMFRLGGGKCDLLAFGELDGSDIEWLSLQQHAGPLIPGSDIAKKACQCFSLHSENSGVGVIAVDIGWVAVRCVNVIVAFVHVPNDIAGSEGKLTIFYRNMMHVVSKSSGGGLIDLVMGDTNQRREGLTPEVLSKATGMTYKDAHPGSVIEPVDAFETKVSGTNAKGTQKYDVAVYNTATLTKAPVTSYVSQFTALPTHGSVVAVTDHMGIIVDVDKK